MAAPWVCQSFIGKIESTERFSVMAYSTPVNGNLNLTHLEAKNGKVKLTHLRQNSHLLINEISGVNEMLTQELLVEIHVLNRQRSQAWIMKKSFRAMLQITVSIRECLFRLCNHVFCFRPTKPTIV